MTTRPGQLSHGIWGPHTALIDWCEQNYHITPFLAEFWNTLSNIPFILMASYGIYRVYQQGLPSSARFAAAYGGMGLVGLGSFFFHATLKYGFQLCDELPMIWFSSFLMWSSFESAPGFVPSRRSLCLLAGTFGVDAVLTVLYIHFPDPLYHQIIFGLLLITVTSRIAYLISSNPLLSPKSKLNTSSILDSSPSSIPSLPLSSSSSSISSPPISRSSPSKPSKSLSSPPLFTLSRPKEDSVGASYKSRITRLYSSGAITFVAGFLAWNLDNETCHLTEGWKGTLGPFWGAILEGHAWWHLLTGLGTFRMLTASTYLFCIIKTYQPPSPPSSPTSPSSSPTSSSFPSSIISPPLTSSSSPSPISSSSSSSSSPSPTRRRSHPEDLKPEDFELVSSFWGLLPYVAYRPNRQGADSLRGKME